MNSKIKNIFSKKNIHYIESITYMLSIIIVVLANVFGPIWIKMIPLLFILGIIGKIVFDRAVVTTIFGAIISVCIVYLSGVTSALENIVESGIFTLYIALGELCGSKLEIIYDYLIKEKNRKDKKIIKSTILTIIIFLICVLFHNYTYSNIFTYNSCKNRLKDYLAENYPSCEFNILYAKYNFESENNFKFNVQDINTSNNYKFIVYLDKKLDIYDGISESEKSKEELKVKNQVEMILNGRYDYIEKSVEKITEGYELILTKQVKSVDDNETLNFSKEISEIINLLLENKELNNIVNIDLSLLSDENKSENKISTIYINGYKKNKEEGIQKDYTYIMKSLNIEYID